MNAVQRHAVCIWQTVEREFALVATDLLPLPAAWTIMHGGRALLVAAEIGGAANQVVIDARHPVSRVDWSSAGSQSQVVLRGLGGDALQWRAHADEDIVINHSAVSLMAGACVEVC